MTDIESELRRAIELSSPTISIGKLAKGVVANSSANWNERYWAAVYLWKFENSDGSHDKELMDCLEAIQRGGLTVDRNRELFLNSSLLLAQLQFKYGRLRQASNYLLLIREHDKTNAPSWVFNYSAKLHFKLDIAFAVASPKVFIQYLNDSADRNDGQYDSQAIALCREYLADSLSYFRMRSSTASQLSVFVQEFRDFAEKLGAEVLSEWSALLLFYSQISQTAQATRVSPNLLEAENKMLSGLLEERSKIIRDQGEEIANLELKLHELEEALQAVTIESDKRNKEIVDQLRGELGITPVASVTQKERARILVLGTPQISEKQLWGIAGTLGLSKDLLDLHLNYDENKRFDLDSLKYNSPYAGILIGPVAHKVIGLGDYASVVQKLQREEGFPPVEEIRTHSGELKITKSSFREALSRILTVVKANNPAPK